MFFTPFLLFVAFMLNYSSAILFPEMTSLRLVYFPVRARAECARMILAFGGIHYQVLMMMVLHQSINVINVWKHLRVGDTSIAINAKKTLTHVLIAKRITLVKFLLTNMLKYVASRINGWLLWVLEGKKYHHWLIIKLVLYHQIVVLGMCAWNVGIVLTEWLLTK